MKRIVVLTAVALAVVVAVTSASASAPRKDLKNFQHVWVVMMENTSDTSLIGNANAPYVNHLAQTYGYARNYFGVTHPSQPNYVAITSGIDERRRRRSRPHRERDEHRRPARVARQDLA